MAFCVIIALQLRGRSIAEATGIDKIRQEERRRMAGNAVDKEEKGEDIIEQEKGDGEDTIRKLRKLGRHNLHVKYDRQYSTSF